MPSAMQSLLLAALGTVCFLALAQANQGSKSNNSHDVELKELGKKLTASLRASLSAIDARRETRMETNDRVRSEFKAHGFALIYTERCSPGVKGYFSPKLPNSRPEVVVCQNNHQSMGGDEAHTEAHEMAHAAQYCLQRRGLVLDDLFDI